MSEFGIGDAICIFIIVLIITALNFGAGITDIFTFIGSHAEIFQYVLLFVWAIVSILSAAILGRDILCLIFDLIGHSGLTVAFGWIGTKMLSSMTYSETAGAGYLEELFSKCLFLGYDLLIISLFICLAMVYIFIEATIHETAYDKIEESAIAKENK